MNEFVVTARKWRPLFFKDVVGQEHITQTLKNAVLKNRIHHAYLFSGPRGVGKTTTARILSRSINCLNPQDAEPCNQCDNCKAVMDGRSLDI
ncbi:MAG: ATP-binding protein, partial [Candidatus Kapaibacterium sp.]